MWPGWPSPSSEGEGHSFPRHLDVRARIDRATKSTVFLLPSVSGIIGVLYSGAGVGVLIGPSVAGYAYDLVQSYTLPILGGVAANLIAVACVAAMPQPERWREAYAV